MTISLVSTSAGCEIAKWIARATAVTHVAEQVDGDAVELIMRALDDDEPLVQLAALEALEALPADRRAALGQRFLTHPLRALRVTAARVLARNATCSDGIPGSPADSQKSGLGGTPKPIASSNTRIGA